MIKVGMPRPVILHKMQKEGVDASILDMDPDGPAPVDREALLSQPQVAIKVDPRFEKFLKMIRM